MSADSHAVVRHGPSVGEYMGRDIPGFIVSGDGERSDFNRIAKVKDGGVELSQLAPDECVIAPGLIYRRSASKTGETR